MKIFNYLELNPCHLSEKDLKFLKTEMKTNQCCWFSDKEPVINLSYYNNFKLNKASSELKTLIALGLSHDCNFLIFRKFAQTLNYLTIFEHDDDEDEDCD